MKRNNLTLIKHQVNLAMTIILLTGCVLVPSNSMLESSDLTSGTSLQSESLTSEMSSSSVLESSTMMSTTTSESTQASTSEPLVYFTVTFDTLGGSLVDAITVLQGTTFIAPISPIKRYHRFQHWYTTTASVIFNFSTAIAQDLTLYASWEVEIVPMSVFNITLDTSIENVNRETYVPALTSLINHDNASGGLTNVVTEIRGRGNGSGWGYEQKSYRLKFDKKQGLFGLNPSRHWLLVPGGHDFSLLRAHAAFTLASIALDYLDFVTSSHYVEVYFNQQYHGVYNLFEHTRVEAGRIDITSDYDLLDTGYLIEYDSYATGIEGIDYFWVQGLRYPFSVKSPEPDEYDRVITEARYREQVSFIQSYVQDVVDAIYQGDQVEITNLIDIPSWIDMYLIHELFKNTDTGWSSFFLYKKPGGKLYVSSPWDFDFSSGISRGDGTVQGLYVGETILYYSDFTSSEMYIRLMQLPFFVSLVKQRYQVFSSRIIYPIADLVAVRVRYQEAFDRHASRWSWYGQWYQDQGYVRSWLSSRRQWLLQWANN
jgi:hypothetical protein